MGGQEVRGSLYQTEGQPDVHTVPMHTLCLLYDLHDLVLMSL